MNTKITKILFIGEIYKDYFNISDHEFIMLVKKIIILLYRRFYFFWYHNIVFFKPSFNEIKFLILTIS